MSLLDLDGIPKTSKITYFGKGPLDDKSYIDKAEDLDKISDYYIVNGMSVFCKENGGHYIYLSGEWKLWEQMLFDKMYKIGCHQFALSEDDLPQPLDPATCEWTLVTSYDGKALWVDSTKDGGTILAGSLPNINGNLGSVMVDQNLSTSGALYYSGTPRVRDWSGADGNGIRSVGFQASRSNSIYSASAGASIVRPTSITIKIFERTK